MFYIRGHVRLAVMTTTPGDQGQVQQQATGAASDGRLSRSEINVLQTMITIIVGFVLCWSITAAVNFLYLFGVSELIASDVREWLSTILHLVKFL